MRNLSFLLAVTTFVAATLTLLVMLAGLALTGMRLNSSTLPICSCLRLIGGRLSTPTMPPSPPSNSVVHQRQWLRYSVAPFILSPETFFQGHAGHPATRLNRSTIDFVARGRRSASLRAGRRSSRGLPVRLPPKLAVTVEILPSEPAGGPAISFDVPGPASSELK
jgi:hypothetical protein